MMIHVDINQMPHQGMSDRERKRREAAQNMGMSGGSPADLANAVPRPPSLAAEINRAETLPERIMQTTNAIEEIIARLDGANPLEGIEKASQAVPMGYVARLGEANRSSVRALDRLDDLAVQLSRILSGVNNE